MSALSTTLPPSIGAGAPRSPRALAGPSPSARPPHVARLVLLIVAMTLMHAVDLACTLTYLRAVGMVELNPIARHIIDIGQAPLLIAFKLLTILASCGTLYLVRRHRLAEIGAWICTAVLVALSLHWTNFNANISRFTNDIAVVALQGGCDRWVSLSD